MKTINKKSIFAGIIMSIMLLAFGTACGNTKAGENEYADWYENYRSDMEDAMLTYTKRVMEVEPGSKDWLDPVDKSLDDIQKIIDRVKNKKDVPATYKKAHEHLLKANKGYQYVVDETPQTLEKMNVESLDILEHRLDKAFDETIKADDEVYKVAKNTKSESKSKKTELEAYVNWYDTHMNTLEDEIDMYDNLMGDSAVGDENWYADIEESLQSTQKLINEAKAKEDVPSEFKKAHRYLLGVDHKYQYVIDKTPMMISESDIEVAQDLSDTIDNVIIEIEKADNEVDRIVDEKGLIE